MFTNLRQLSIEWDSIEPKVPEEQGQPLCVVAGGGEDDEGVASQLIEDVDQVGVLGGVSGKGGNKPNFRMILNLIRNTWFSIK